MGEMFRGRTGLIWIPTHQFSIIFPLIAMVIEHVLVALAALLLVHDGVFRDGIMGAISIILMCIVIKVARVIVRITV